MGISVRTLVLAILAVLGATVAALAQDQQADTAPADNSAAIARKLMASIHTRQTGNDAPPAWAYEVDFNLDGFSELYGFFDAPNCDGRYCGLFVYVLEGDSYREVLGDIPGAKLTAPDKVFLGAFQRNGFIDLQLDQTLVSWNGQQYADAASFPTSMLNGDAFLEACRKSFGDAQEEGQAEAETTCTCQFDRLQATNMQQSELDDYVLYMNTDTQKFDNLTDDAWNAVLAQTGDATKGCDIASGKQKWEPAYFPHGDQPQSLVDLDGFIDACSDQDWIVGHRKVGTPDRAVGLCGCLAREIPTYGVNQDGIDMLARYYANEASDADVDAEQSDLLDLHDKASEACLAQFPSK